jgi:tetratricopeptide (TPR) repeat protein
MLTLFGRSRKHLAQITGCPGQALLIVRVEARVKRKKGQQRAEFEAEPQCYNSAVIVRTNSAGGGICRRGTSCALILANFCFAFVLLAGAVFGQSKDSRAEKLLAEARTAIANQQWERALASYDSAIQAEPRSEIPRVEKAMLLKQMGLYPESIAGFEDALRISPGNQTATLGLGDAYRLAFNYEQARRVMELAHKEHPASAAPLVALGELDIQMQKYDDAVLHLNQALRLNAKDRAAGNDLALAFKAKGDLAKALAQLDRLIAESGNDPLTLYLRASIHADRNENEQALADAQKLFTLEPGNPRGRLLLGQLQVRSERCAEAVEVLEPLAAAPDSEASAIYLLSQAYRCAGQADLARETMERFEAVSKEQHAAKEGKVQSEHLVDQAGELARSNQFPGAIELLRQAVEKDPRNGGAYSQLAKIYYSQGEIQSAHNAVSKALETNPAHPDYLFVAGKILEKEGKLEEALAAFEKTALVNPREADAYFEMGLIYEQRKDRARAIAAYKKAVQLAPEDPDYRRALAAASAGAGPR